MTEKLTVKQARFLEFYLGGEPELAGNATASYLKVYNCKRTAAAVSGKRLLGNAKIKKAITKHQERVQVKTTVDAAWVLERAVELFEQARGTAPMVHEKLVEKTDESGSIFFEKQRFELCNTNLSVANQILLTIGRNKSVGAFQDNVEVNHTDRLERILNERQKKVEAAAVVRQQRRKEKGMLQLIE